MTPLPRAAHCSAALRPRPRLPPVMIAMVRCRLRLVLKTVYGSLPSLAASVPVPNLPISAPATDVLWILETAYFSRVMRRRYERNWTRRNVGYLEKLTNRHAANA
jgi:hypothetical protein